MRYVKRVYFGYFRGGEMDGGDRGWWNVVMDSFKKEGVPMDLYGHCPVCGQPVIGGCLQCGCAANRLESFKTHAKLLGAEKVRIAMELAKTIAEAQSLLIPPVPVAPTPGSILKLLRVEVVTKADLIIWLHGQLESVECDRDGDVFRGAIEIVIDHVNKL
jgi:hypothetical protein